MELSNASRRRILIIGPCCDGTDVGEAWSTYQWVKRLAQRHSVTLLTYSKCGRPEAAPQLPGVEVVEWRDWPLLRRFERFNAALKPGYISFYWSARSWLHRAVVRRRFEIIHQISPLALRYPSPGVGFGIPVVIGPLAGSLPTPPGFVHEVRRGAWYLRLRSLDAWRLRHDALLRNTYEQAAVVIGVAPYVRELLSGVRLQQFELMSETGVVEIPVQAPRSAARTDGALRLLFVGRVVRTKGVRDIVRALVKLKDQAHVTLDVVGEGDDRGECEREAERLGLSGRVRFHGRRPRGEVERFYQQADVFVFPSFREASGNAVLEAMSHGLAMIVADVGGPSYAVDEQCGIKVPVTTPTQYASDLAAAITRFVSSRGLVAQMGSASRWKAISTYSWESKVAWMCDLYERTACQRSTRYVPRPNTRPQYQEVCRI
jgi:glycosyltransferase involved in cell wall biosynthesis